MTPEQTAMELAELATSMLGIKALMPQVFNSPRYKRDMLRCTSLIIEGFSFSQALEIVMEENRKAEHETSK